MSNDLRLLITADLNRGLTIDAINKKIREIEKSKSLKAINLKIDIDKNLTNSIAQFTKAANQLNKIISDQNKILKTETTTFQDSTGAIVKQTREHLANGEIIQRVTKDTTKLINTQESEIQTTQDLTQKVNQLANARQKLNQVVLNSDGSVNKKTQSFGDDFSTLTQTTNKNGNVTQTITDNYEKQYQRNLKLQQEIEAIEKKRIKNVDAAEYAAYKEKEKREKHLHDLRLKEEAFLRKKADIENKIAVAQQKYGHHKQVSSGLKDIESQINGITMSQKNWNDSFKSIETNIKKTTTGFKAIRNESVGIAEGMGTALIKFPISATGGDKTSLTAGTPLELFKLQRKDETDLFVNV